MESLDRFLEYHAQRLFERGLLSQPDELPVNLTALATAAGVLSIEERPMIPEAVLCTERTGFKIYLQGNFVGVPGVRTRQRFSLAHEIAHTFFYELRDGRLRVVPGAPRGEKLEAACHRGAGLLVVPQRLLVRELRRINKSVGAARAIELSRKFDVSAEVMIRRLNQAHAFDSTELAIVLVRRSNREEAVIDFADYPSWLKSLLPTPSRGMGFTSWLGCAQFQRPRAQSLTAGTLASSVDVLFKHGIEKRTASGMLRVIPHQVTASQYIFELAI